MPIPSIPKRWNGTTWEDITIARWDGAAWVPSTLQQMGGSVPDGLVPGWGLPTFEDHFEGTAGAAPNSTYWTRNGPTSINTDDVGYIQPANAFLDGNSHLVIRVQKRAVPFGPDQYGKTRTYDTGYITSAGKVQFSYGRWEVRYLSLHPMNSRGIWPAAWIRDGTSASFEGDISESVGSPCAHPSSYPNDGSGMSTTLWQSTGVGTEGTNKQSAVFKLATVDPSAQVSGLYYGWHVGAIEMLPGRVTIYSDNVKVNEVTSATANGRNIISGLKSTQHMRLNVQVGSTWAGEPDDADTASPYDWLVDYVRFWPYDGTQV